MAKNEQTAEQIAAQAVQEAGQQAAKQIAQAAEQFAQKLGVSVARSHLDTTTTARDIAEETGMGESFQAGNVAQTRAWDTNLKRTYDEYQAASLDQMRALNAITVRALNNAEETANMTGKQALRHAELAIDRQWNVDEVAAHVAKTAFFSDAVAAAVAAAFKARQEEEESEA